MKLIRYILNKNDDETYNLNYDYVNEAGNIIHACAPRVEVNLVFESLIGRTDIMFPNIKGHTIIG